MFKRLAGYRTAGDLDDAGTVTGVNPLGPVINDTLNSSGSSYLTDPGTEEDLSHIGTSFMSGATTGWASGLKKITQAGAKVVNTVVRKAQSVVTGAVVPPPATGMENETLLYVAVGAGVLYFMTKKKKRR